MKFPNASIFEIAIKKGNPLFSKLLDLVCNNPTELLTIDLDHKMMGSFNPCRFEMLKIVHSGKVSHSASNYKSKINGIGRIYKTYISS